MNILRLYTKRNLSENKTRTIVTIIGIILSVAMFTATIEAFVTVKNYLISYTEMFNGKYHVSFCEVEKEDFDKIISDERVKDFTYITDLGYAEINSENEYKPYLYIGGIPDDFTDIMPVNLTSGRLPENSSELVVSEHLFLNGNVSLELGQQITLCVGERSVNSDDQTSKENEGDGGLHLSQRIPLRTANGDHCSEKLINLKNRTYTVVGFCARPDKSIEIYEAPGYTAFTVAEESLSTSSLYIVLSNPYIYEEYYSEIKRDYDVMWGSVNYDLLMFSFKSFNSAFPVLAIGLLTILILLIIFGSVALIYNSFSISVSEKVKQYGIIKSVGATKKQIKRSVFYEAAYLCAYGIPIGIISGCIGIAVTFNMLSDEISTYLSDLTDLKMNFVFSPLAITAAVILGFVTVIISAYIPAKKVIAVNPVDSVRQSAEIKIKRKSVKISPVTGKIFGFEATLSSKNFKRNKRKYRTTVFSLFVSVVLFISASSLATYFTDIVEVESGDLNYDVSVEIYDFSYLDISGDVSVTGDLIMRLYNGIKGIEGIDDIAFSQKVTTDYDIDKYYISNEFIQMSERERGNSIKEKDVLNNSFTYNFIDDASFRSLLIANGLEEKEFFDKSNPKALLYDKATYVYQNGGDERVYIVSFLDDKKLNSALEIKKILGSFTENGVTYYYFGQTQVVDSKTYYIYDIGRNEGDIVDDSGKRYLAEEDAVSYPVISIGAVLTEKPYFIGVGTNLIYPESLKEYVFADPVSDTDFYIKARDHKRVTSEIEKVKRDVAGAANNISVTDYAAEIESTRALVTIAKVLAYGFIVLISMIASANVFNTISTNILLRKREIAMLKSVGLTKKGLIKMMIFESLLYGIKSLLFSLPTALGITYIIYLVASDSGYVMGFYVPWDKFLIAVFSVFVIVAVSMLYALIKIDKLNTVDALKNENT